MWTTLLELAGAACIVAGLFLIGTWIGLVGLGLLMVAAGWLFGGDE